jgi:uncharacterized repeat protein (TIGR01451 family)
MSNHQAVPSARGGRLRRTAAALTVIAAVTLGTLALTVATAGADAADVASAHAVSVVVNGDGSITVTLAGDWVWTTHDSDCNLDRFAVGWATDWNDANSPGNHLATLGLDSIDVGVATADAFNVADNNVRYYADTPRCGVFDAGDGFNSGTYGERTDQMSGTTGFNGFLTHTYAPGTDPTTIAPCVVTYDVHGDEAPDPGDKEVTAGGDDHNGDNSVEKNSQTPAGNVCAPVTIAPDVKIVKTGPTTGTVGVAFNYTLTASNTGIVPADDTTITDVLPASLTFNSATAPCTFNAGTRTVTCDLGTLGVGASSAVTINVTPTQPGTVSNTAVVTPDDVTPGDNTSTWVIGNIEAAAEVVIQPAFTG